MGWLPRLAGAVVAVGYTEWTFVAMSYSKIDHDRFALLVALWCCPPSAERILAPPRRARRPAARCGR